MARRKNRQKHKQHDEAARRAYAKEALRRAELTNLAQAVWEIAKESRRKESTVLGWAEEYFPERTAELRS